MKQLLRRAARWLASKPGIGRFVRIGIAVVRLPISNDRQQIFLTQQLPQLLDTLSDINHRQANLDRDQENLTKTAPITLRQLTRDVLTLRREIEALKRAASQSTEQLANRPTPENRNRQVKLGSGSGPQKGRLIMDYPLPGTATVAHLDNLPLENAQVHDIYASHVLECFSPKQLSESLLPRLCELLAPEGRLHVTALDSEAMMRGYSLGTISHDDLRDSLFGLHATESDEPRLSVFTAGTLTQLLLEAGFANVQLIGEARRNGNDLEFEIVAQKEKALQ